MPSARPTFEKPQHHGHVQDLRLDLVTSLALGVPDLLGHLGQPGQPGQRDPMEMISLATKA